jgi:hypothetical protein
MIQQLDIISKTMKIMDQRIGTVENQVTEIYDVHKENKRDYYKSLPKKYAQNDGNNNMNMNYGKNTSNSNSMRSNRQGEFKANENIEGNNNYAEQNYYMNDNNNNEDKQMYIQNNEYDNNNISASKVKLN